jgi:hypothetical protein
MKADTKNSKFAQVYEKGTNGINYDLSTDDIVAMLERWDALYSIEISDVDNDRLLVQFASLPDDLSDLAKEIYEFCPDVIDQHFGCMDDMVEMMGDEELPPELADLVEGVDFEDENFGEILLQRALKSSKAVALWWD